MARPQGHVFIAASLDGYIARPDGALDWLERQPVRGEDHGFTSFMDRMSGIVMGRASYEKVLAFADWPYSKPLVVLSQSLKPQSVPDRLKGMVEITHLSPDSLFDYLGQKGWQHAYVDGGQVIQSCLRLGLIDEITITHVPVLIGSGRPLFGFLPQDVNLRHHQTTSFRSGLVSSHYWVAK